MELSMEKTGDVAVVKLPGDRLDAGNVDVVRQAVAAILEKHPKMALDMSQLEFVDSSALGVFIMCLRRAKAAGGDLKMFSMTKSVRVIFELVRFHRIIDIFNDKEEAVKAFRS